MDIDELLPEGQSESNQVFEMLLHLSREQLKLSGKCP